MLPSENLTSMEAACGETVATAVKSLTIRASPSALWTRPRLGGSFATLCGRKARRNHPRIASASRPTKHAASKAASHRGSTQHSGHGGHPEYGSCQQFGDIVAHYSTSLNSSPSRPHRALTCRIAIDDPGDAHQRASVDCGTPDSLASALMDRPSPWIAARSCCSTVGSRMLTGYPVAGRLARGCGLN